MADERDSKLLGIFAKNANPVIPPNPVKGVAYIDETTTQVEIENGLKFDTIIEGAKLNEMLNSIYKIANELDKQGVLGWNDAITYTAFPALVRGSDGIYYKSTQAVTLGLDPVGDGTGAWLPLVTASVNSSETTRGIAELATQAEVNTGADDLRIITPKKLKNFTGFPSLPFRGALVNRTVDQSIPDDIITNVDWQAEVYDTDNIWDISQAQRLIVPAGVTKVRVSAGMTMESLNSGFARADIKKNGTSLYFGIGRDNQAFTSISTSTIVDASTAIIPVVGGDFFEFVITQTGGSAKNMNFQQSWFQMEILA